MDLDAVDLNIVCAEEVKSEAKRGQKLEELFEKGYVMVYSQCLQDGRDKQQ